mmetsp:Transcript_7160/g.21015  ORF Transcript_7160/g.21015 Transcript_7160/m.21015 type:complete len:205 (+) Transcript_7160:1094-1708(+)
MADGAAPVEMPVLPGDLMTRGDIVMQGSLDIHRVLTHRNDITASGHCPRDGSRHRRTAAARTGELPWSIAVCSTGTAAVTSAQLRRLLPANGEVTTVVPASPGTRPQVLLAPERMRAPVDGHAMCADSLVTNPGIAQRSAPTTGRPCKQLAMGQAMHGRTSSSLCPGVRSCSGSRRHRTAETALRGPRLQWLPLPVRMVQPMPS